MSLLRRPPAGEQVRKLLGALLLLLLLLSRSTRGGSCGHLGEGGENPTGVSSTDAGGNVGGATVVAPGVRVPHPAAGTRPEDRVIRDDDSSICSLFSFTTCIFSLWVC